MNKADPKKEKNEDSKNLGVLYTGYLDKRNPVTGSFKKRFVVLTHDALHWFKRTEGYDLFGEERGHVVLNNILTTRILDEDSTAFEVQGTDNNRRVFRGSTPAICEEWVSAIRSAIKALKRPGVQRRSSLTGIRNNLEENEEHDGGEVNILLVSLCSAENQNEVVIARDPEYGRVITVPSFKPDDSIIISTSNGGSVLLTYEVICLKAEDDVEFDVAVQNVPLASSLKLSLMMDTDKSRLDKKNARKTLHKQVSEIILLISQDRSLGIGVVLSGFVLLTGLRSLHNMRPDLVLLLLFSFALAAYNIYQTFEACWAEQATKSCGRTLRLVIHTHAFTSPDVPVVDADNEIPRRFIDGCDGDLKEARQRWDITRHWRETEGINTILEEPQPFFFLIKKMYPHYHSGRGKLGHVIYWERPAELEHAQLSARGVTTDHLVRHWLFTTEYQWQILCNNDETAKSIAVIDMAGVTMASLAGESVAGLKRTISIANQHYPERSFVIYVVNAPFYFSMAWKIVKPLVHENTQKKVRILSPKETLKGLQEHIDISQIPEYYGGQLDFGGRDSCRYSSPETLAMNEYVRKINEGSSTASKVPFSDEAPLSTRETMSTGSTLPPGNPGESGDPSNANIGPAGPATVTPRGVMGRHASLTTSPKRTSLTPVFQNVSEGNTDHESTHEDWSITSATTAPSPLQSSPRSASQIMLLQASTTKNPPR